MSDKPRNKILVYYNPRSGSGVFKDNLDYIIERCQDKGFQAIPIRASKGLVIDQTLASMDQEEYDRIFVCGGDGTVNLCVKAMIRNDIHLPLAILPSGTANDFAYYFELPSAIDEIMDVALGDKCWPADVGKVNDKHFVNVTAMGALIDVSQKTDPNLKNTLGTVAYYLTALTELPQVRAFPVKLTADDQVYEEEIYFMVVMNGESAGGFRKLNPESSISDGKLDVIAFRKMPLPQLGPLLIEVVRGKHYENKHVLNFKTEKLIIESDVDLSTDIDGEHGEQLPLHFSVLHNRLNIFVKGNEDDE